MTRTRFTFFVVASLLVPLSGCSHRDDAGDLTGSSGEFASKIPKPATDRMLIEVDGSAAGYGTTLEVVKTSRPPFKGLRVSVGANMTAGLRDWLDDALAGDKKSHDGSIYLGANQRLDFKNAHFDEIQLPLVDSGLSEPTYLSLTFAPKAAKVHGIDPAGDEQAIAAATELAQIQTFSNSFQFQIDGLVLKGVRTTAGARHPTKHYSAWGLSGLETEHSSVGFDDMVALVKKVFADAALEDEEYSGSTEYLDPKTGQPVLSVAYESAVPISASEQTGVAFRVGQFHVAASNGDPQDAGKQ
jgi:hypothetical protein